MQKVNFILPKNFNSGDKIPVNLIKSIESDIIAVSGGLTKYNATGFWKNDSGKLFADRNILYFTVISSQHELTEIIRILTIAKHTLQQESIYLEVTDSQVSFI
jgi:hypothetical protein